MHVYYIPELSNLYVCTHCTVFTLRTHVRTQLLDVCVVCVCGVTVRVCVRAFVVRACVWCICACVRAFVVRACVWCICACVHAFVVCVCVFVCVCVYVCTCMLRVYCTVYATSSPCSMDC